MYTTSDRNFTDAELFIDTFERMRPAAQLEIRDASDTLISEVVDDYPRLFDISSAFDSSPNIIYTDGIHVTHFGNEIIANIIAEDVRNAIQTPSENSE